MPTPRTPLRLSFLIVACDEDVFPLPVGGRRGLHLTGRASLITCRTSRACSSPLFPIEACDVGALPVEGQRARETDIAHAHRPSVPVDACEDDVPVEGGVSTGDDGDGRVDESWHASRAPRRFSSPLLCVACALPVACELVHEGRSSPPRSRRRSCDAEDASAPPPHPHRVASLHIIITLRLVPTQPVCRVRAHPRARALLIFAQIARRCGSCDADDAFRRRLYASSSPGRTSFPASGSPHPARGRGASHLARPHRRSLSIMAPMLAKMDCASDIACAPCRGGASSKCSCATRASSASASARLPRGRGLSRGVSEGVRESRHAREMGTEMGDGHWGCAWARGGRHAARGGGHAASSEGQAWDTYPAARRTFCESR